MNRIDRYITGIFWGYFIGALAVFVTIFLAMDAMSTMVSYRGIPMDVFGRYYACMAPEILHKMLPVASVMGAILTLASLNRANELVALFASGMSLMRIAAPIIIWVSGIGIGSYVMSDQVLPTLAKQKNYVWWVEIRKRPEMFSVVKNSRIWYKSKNNLYNIKTLKKGSDNRAEGLTLYSFNDDWDLLQMTTANQVIMSQDRWELLNGSVTVFTAESSFPLTSNFARKVISMGEKKADLQETGQTSEILTQAELSKFIRKNKEAGLDTVRYEVDYHAKFGFACSGLIMVLLGIPFSVGRARSGGIMMNVGIVLGLVFGFWILYNSSLSLGANGYIPPILAAWSPNLLMGGFALYLFKKMGK